MNMDDFLLMFIPTIITAVSFMAVGWWQFVKKKPPTKQENTNEFAEVTGRYKDLYLFTKAEKDEMEKRFQKLEKNYAVLKTEVEFLRSCKRGFNDMIDWATKVFFVAEEKGFKKDLPYLKNSLMKYVENRR